MIQKEFGKKLKLKKVTIAILSGYEMNGLRGGAFVPDRDEPADNTTDNTTTVSEPTGPTAYDSSCTCLIVEQNLFKA